MVDYIWLRPRLVAQIDFLSKGSRTIRTLAALIQEPQIPLAEEWTRAAGGRVTACSLASRSTDWHFRFDRLLRLPRLQSSRLVACGARTTRRSCQPNEPPP